MLTGSSKLDEKAKWWRLDPSGQTSPRVVHRLKKGHEEAVTAFAISPDSKLLFTGDRGGLGNIWNASTGRRVGEPLELLLGNRINAASFSADGKRLLIGSDDEQLTVIDVASRRLVTRLNHKGYVTQLSICKDERHALTVSELVTDLEFVTTATLWDLHDGQKQVLDRVASPLDPDRGYQRTNPQRITSARFDDAGRVAVVSRAEVGAAPALIRVWKMSDLIADRGLMSPSRRTLTSTDVSSKSLSASRSAGRTSIVIRRLSLWPNVLVSLSPP